MNDKLNKKQIKDIEDIISSMGIKAPDDNNVNNYLDIIKIDTFELMKKVDNYLENKSISWGINKYDILRVKPENEGNYVYEFLISRAKLYAIYKRENEVFDTKNNLLEIKTTDSSNPFYYAISHYKLFYSVKSEWTTFWEATKYFSKEHAEIEKKYLEEKYNIKLQVIKLQVTECIDFGCINSIKYER